MKYLMLVCEGLTDDPIEELGDRTPLEVARTPALDALAKKGVTASASFVPRSMSVSSDIACMSILGYQPAQFYTGIAPLEALAMDVEQTDRDVAFRCDLVTILDDILVDTSAGRISPTESRLLVDELNRQLSGATVKIHPGKEGYKNILMISDPELAEKLDDLECTSPKGLVGHPFAKSLPRGQKAAILTDLMDKSKVILDSQEINRVRIDLGENPANMIWPWGQGKKPKMPGFKERFGMSGAVVSGTEFARGLGKAAGLDVYQDLEAAVDARDFVFVFMEFDDEIYRTNNLKSKVKLIEDFDSGVVAPALKLSERLGDHRVCVATDRVWSRTKKTSLYGQVPVLLAGRGIESAPGNEFSEKKAAQSQLNFSEGHKLMEHFLKG